MQKANNLRMLSLDKVAKRFDFHSTAPFSLDCFDEDQTSLDITRRHSTRSTRWPNDSIFYSISRRVENRVKNRVVWSGLKSSNEPQGTLPNLDFT